MFLANAGSDLLLALTGKWMMNQRCTSTWIESQHKINRNESRMPAERNDRKILYIASGPLKEQVMCNVLVTTRRRSICILRIGRTKTDLGIFMFSFLMDS